MNRLAGMIIWFVLLGCLTRLLCYKIPWNVLDALWPSHLPRTPRYKLMSSDVIRAIHGLKNNNNMSDDYWFHLLFDHAPISKHSRAEIQVFTQSVE